MRFLLTERQAGRLLRASVVANLTKAQVVASNWLFRGEVTMAFRRQQNAALTYDGVTSVTIGDVTIEPMS